MSHSDLKSNLTEEISPIIHEQVEDDFDIRAGALESEIAERYNEDWVKIFKRLVYEIAVVGMPIKEACLIVGVEHEKLVMLMKADPLIGRLIQTKDIEYKRTLLKAVSTKARTDDKMSQWLLQARYPDEFNPRKGSAPSDQQSDDLLGIAIEFIQKSGDASPLVAERSAKISVVGRPSDNKSMMERISKILK